MAERCNCERYFLTSKIFIIYTANSIIFFKNPMMKNAAIGEKSIPPEFKGILFLIGPRIGSVTERRKIEN